MILHKFNHHGAIQVVTIDTTKRYGNGQQGILLTSQPSCEPYMKASVCLVNEKIENDEVIIKNYAENEGVLKFLQDEKIIGETLREIDLGHVKVQVCKLLKK